MIRKVKGIITLKLLMTVVINEGRGESDEEKEEMVGRKEE